MGALVLLDGSQFAWLEDRGPTMTLLGAIDDATGTVVALYFRPTEDLHGYVTLLAQLAHRHGLPLTLYGDRLNVFVRNDRHWSLEEELQGAQHPTHFGRILQDLAIGYIAAGSPQAKGRIERLWRTLQDRLVVELRLRGLATLEAANAFLPAFLADFNPRFAHPAAEPTSAWRRPPPDLANVLSCRYRRTVARDNTVRLGARWAQIPRGRRGRSYAGCHVEAHLFKPASNGTLGRMRFEVVAEDRGGALRQSRDDAAVARIASWFPGGRPRAGSETAGCSFPWRHA